MMTDGHLGKCKECTKRDSEIRRKEKEKDPKWVEAEYERHRIKSRRRRANGIMGKQTKENRRNSLKKYFERHPEQKIAHEIFQQAIKKGTIERQPCVVCNTPNAQGHHDNYLKPLNVMWLCPKHHYERHVHLRKIARLAKFNSLISKKP